MAHFGKKAKKAFKYFAKGKGKPMPYGKMNSKPKGMPKGCECK
jgi:hypothetical protein